MEWQLGLNDRVGGSASYVCWHSTPNHLHAPTEKRALTAGAHVVCEKPLAMDPAEGAELLRLKLGQGGT